MTLLNRYVLTAFGRVAALSLAAFVGLYLLVDFFEKLDSFIEHKAAISHYLLYLLNKIPGIAVQVVPLAVLMAVFLTLGGMSRTQELTAIRAGGVSLWRVSAPLIGAAFGLSILVFVANEYVLPIANRNAHHILRSEVKGKKDLVFKRDRLWLREGDQIINVRLADPDKGELHGISIFETDKDFKLLSRTDANSAKWMQDGWMLKDGYIRRFGAEDRQLMQSEPFREQKADLPKKPEDFQIAEWRNDELGYQELRRLSHKLQQEGYDTTRFRVDMHSRLALPFANLVMACLGIPFALQKGRGASISLGVALTVAIGIAYHLLLALLTTFGYAGLLPPIVAAWSAHLLFSGIALWFTLSARE